MKKPSKKLSCYLVIYLIAWLIMPFGVMQQRAYANCSPGHVSNPAFHAPKPTPAPAPAPAPPPGFSLPVTPMGIMPMPTIVIPQNLPASPANAAVSGALPQYTPMPWDIIQPGEKIASEDQLPSWYKNDYRSWLKANIADFSESRFVAGGILSGMSKEGLAEKFYQDALANPPAGVDGLQRITITENDNKDCRYQVGSTYNSSSVGGYTPAGAEVNNQKVAYVRLLKPATPTTAAVFEVYLEPRPAAPTVASSGGTGTTPGGTGTTPGGTGTTPGGTAPVGTTPVGTTPGGTTPVDKSSLILKPGQELLPGQRIIYDPELNDYRTTLPGEVVPAPIDKSSLIIKPGQELLPGQQITYDQELKAYRTTLPGEVALSKSGLTRSGTERMQELKENTQQLSKIGNVLTSVNHAIVPESTTCLFQPC